jgi:hypothetical protein
MCALSVTTLLTIGWRDILENFGAAFKDAENSSDMAAVLRQELVGHSGRFPELALVGATSCSC